MWEVEGSAGRAGIGADEVDRASRTYWEAEADTYQAEHGAFLMERAAPTSVARPSVMDSVHEVSQIHDTSAEVDGTAVAGARVAAGAEGDGAEGDGAEDDGAEDDGAEGGRAEGGRAEGDRGGFVWGPEGLTETAAALLGPVDALVGARVLEVGCGAAQCSRWLADRGVHAIGIDISIAQLRHASPFAQLRHPSPLAPTASGPQGRCDVVAATATALPFLDASFDLAFASYGAIQFVADLPRLLSEVRRVLRPGGRWVFSVTHPIRWAFPDDPGPAGLSVSGSYFDRTPYVERDGSGAAVYAEFHRTTGDYVTALVAVGFAIDTIVEPEWPDWNDATWGGWSPLRGTHLPGTLIFGCRADGAASGSGYR